MKWLIELVITYYKEGREDYAIDILMSAVDDFLCDLEYNVVARIFENALIRRKELPPSALLLMYTHALEWEKDMPPELLKVFGALDFLAHNI